MPSTATITSFYSFTQNTKARASQVNTNFSTFRGHIVPVDPNTATAIHNTYDLGSTEYRWRNVYSRSIDLLTNTTSGNSLSIYGNTSTSTPGFIFEIAGTERFRVNTSGYVGRNGNPLTSFTTSAAALGIASSGRLGASITNTTTTAIVGSTITLVTTGRPVRLSLEGIGATSNSTSQLTYTKDLYVRFFQNGTRVAQFGYNEETSPSLYLTAQPGVVSTILMLAAGTYNFHLELAINPTASISPIISDMQLIAYEL